MRPDTKSWDGGGNRCDQTRNPGGRGEKQVRPDTKSGGEKGATKHAIRGEGARNKCDSTQNPGGGTGATKHAILEGGGKKQVRPNTQFGGGGGGGLSHVNSVWCLFRRSTRLLHKRRRTRRRPGCSSRARTPNSIHPSEYSSLQLPPPPQMPWGMGGGGGVSKYNLLPISSRGRTENSPPPPGVSTAY